MPNNISGFIDSELSGLVKSDEKQKIGIAGFYMLAVINQGFTKSSSIPFVPLENGSFASDHIVQSPLTINITGFASDIYQAPSAAQLAYMRAVAEIGNVDRYLPNYTRQQINAINSLVNDVTNQIRMIDDIINTGEQLFNLFSTNSESKGLAEQFLDLINALMDNDQVIKIEMPYKIYENMAISNFSVNYSSEYSSAFDFNLTASQIRYANTILEDSSKYYKKPSKNVKDQTSGDDKKGINKTKEVPVSGLSHIKNAFTGKAVQ